MEVLESYPKSGLFKVDDETENKLKNGLGTINFKDLLIKLKKYMQIAYFNILYTYF